MKFGGGKYVIVFKLDIRLTFDPYNAHLSNRYHYDKTPIQYTVIFHGCKNDYFQMKNYDIFLIFAQNIHLRYTLEQRF